MGSHKKDHIRLILAMEPVAQQWQQRCGRATSDEDIDALFREFIPLQAEVIGHHADVIPGVAHTVELLRQRGIAIGSTTGYTRAVMRTARETRVAVGT